MLPKKALVLFFSDVELHPQMHFISQKPETVRPLNGEARGHFRLS